MLKCITYQGAVNVSKVSSSDKQHGSFIIANYTGDLLKGGSCTCVIAALHCLKQKYRYKQTSEILSSADLVSSQISKSRGLVPCLANSSNNMHNRPRHQQISPTGSAARCSGVPYFPH